MNETRNGLVTAIFWTWDENGDICVVMHRKKDRRTDKKTGELKTLRFYAFPGGEIEDGESENEAVVREIGQECSPEMATIISNAMEDKTVAILDVERLGRGSVPYNQRIFLVFYPIEFELPQHGYVEYKPKGVIHEEVGAPQFVFAEQLTAGGVKDEDGEFKISPLHRDTLWRVAQTLTVNGWDYFKELADSTEKFAFK